MPCGPEQSSGKRLLHALSKLPAPPQPQQAVGLVFPNAFARAAPGAGAVRPRTAVPALGGLSAEGLTPCRLPLHALPGLWGPAAAPAERPAQPWRVLSALGRCAAVRPLTRALRTLLAPLPVQTTAIGQGRRPSCHKWLPRQIAGEPKLLFTPPAACPGCPPHSQSEHAPKASSSPCPRAIPSHTDTERPRKGVSH